MNGFIKLYREILNHRMWHNVDEYRMFTYLVMNAHHGNKPRQLGPVTVKRGQFLRSYRHIREDLMYYDNNEERRYSLDKIKRLLDKLEPEISREETTLGTLFTVRKYALYQDKTSKEEEAPNTPRTGSEHPPNNNKKGKNINIYLPEDFQITERLKRWATERGFTEQQMLSQLPEFKDHHTREKTKHGDWELAFERWMRNAKKWGHLEDTPVNPLDQWKSYAY